MRRLAEAKAAGLGLAVGLDHAELPEALIEEAEANGLPLFELPFELPFIAITEWASTRLINEGYAALERSVEVHARLEGLVLAERGLPEIMRAIAESVAGAAMLLDERGQELARHPQERGFSQRAASDIRIEVNERAEAGRQAMFVAERGSLAGRAVAVPVPLGGSSGRGHWLVLARRSGEIGDLERLLARQAAMVIALELMRERAVRETERRLAGDVLAEALGGKLGDEDLRGRLQPFGIDGRVAVLLFELEESADDPVVLAEAIGVPALVAVNAAAGRPLLCAIVDPAIATRSSSPARVARLSRIRAGASGPPRAGRPRSRRLRRGFHEARCALEATAMANGHTPRRRLSPRPRRLHPAALAAGRRRPSHLLGEPARADLGGGGRVRTGAPALARGVHRAQRAVGEGRPRPLLPSAHPAVQNPQNRGADRARSRAGSGPHRTLARPPCARVGEMR